MKILLTMLMLLAGTVASAETINLNTSNCGAQRYCTTVYNDAVPAVGITIDALTAHVSVTAYVNGKVYSAPYGNAPTTVTPAGQPAQPVSIVDLTLTADDGSAIVLNATFTGVRTLHRSGHNYWTTQWTLVSGTIER